jgi:DNA-binding transcriptional ArsR family regulator
MVNAQVKDVPDGAETIRTAGRPATVAAAGTTLPEHELLARVFRALGEVRRLRIVELLLQCGEMSQTELLRELQIPQSRASKHLHCLVWCGFLSVERRGRMLIYRVADQRTPLFLRLAREFLDGNEAAISSCRTVVA